MSSTWGKNIKISLFGESHGEAVGVVIDGLPAGVELDYDFIREEMKRRAPGRSSISTPRKEDDEVNIISGVFNGRTTGTPLCCVIKNKNKISKDYEKIRYVLRPGHADYTGYIKHRGYNDYRGGGHFSGRLTAPLVFAGAVAKIILSKRNIFVGSHIKSIKNIQDLGFDFCNVDESTLIKLRQMEFPVLNDCIEDEMKRVIKEAKEDGDSVGGVIEVAVINVEEGLGSPFFDSIESRLSHLLFSIPAVKGVEFGEGFNITNMLGSDANDEFYIENGKIKTRTNYNGGILGGISNGMPIIFRVAIKPTPSILKRQKTVNISLMEEVELQVEGRHDACIVPRAVPVVEAVTSIGILDMMIEREGYSWIK
ncbi:chorismate synthase [Thermobrachium celere]|uniref:chorismate synthase n=1 Tax=Thermobrachium celere TaxID=53422 RepID=UPI0019435923|nr:chorismate synthase [Thermobrachium celere]GFR36193.1 chorismate synthase [Thermobrachium celere]